MNHQDIQLNALREAVRAYAAYQSTMNDLLVSHGIPIGKQAARDFAHGYITGCATDGELVDTADSDVLARSLHRLK